MHFIYQIELFYFTHVNKVLPCSYTVQPDSGSQIVAKNANSRKGELLLSSVLVAAGYLVTSRNLHLSIG